jgi:hypothetical protein
MVESLYKAPDGFSEKMQELMIGGGVEYWYDNQFAVRGGYFHESKNKGSLRTEGKEYIQEFTGYPKQTSTLFF